MASADRARPADGRPDSGGADHVRLQKVLASAGVGSRRACEALIAQGRVQVDGHVVREQGVRVDPASAVIKVDGLRVAVPQADQVYLALNKPAGVLSTMSDDRGRMTLTDLLPDRVRDSGQRLFHVGRLDADTEGLLLLTNDGELAHRLTHPSYGVEKEYLVHVRGDPDRSVLHRLRTGVELDDGMTAPARASLVAPSVLRLRIHEGRNRQVRRMCETVGHPVERLVRVRIGPISDRGLGPGEWRELEPAELRTLERAAATSSSTRPGSRRPADPR